MKLSDLAYMSRFLICTEALGSILCHNYTVDTGTKISQWLVKNKGADADAFIRFFVTKLCVVSENLKDPSKDYITPDQSLLLTKDELEYFSQEFIKHNYSLFQCFSVDKYKKNTNEKGRFTIDIEQLVADEKKRLRVKDNCSLLLYALKDYHENYRRRVMEKFDGISDAFSATTRSLFEENMRLSGDILGKSLHDSLQTIEIPPAPYIPDNPIYETNRSVGVLAEKMGAVSQLVNNMNELAMQMSLDSAINARKAQRWNSIMFGLGFVSLVITAFFSYMGLQSANQSSVVLEGLIEKQNALLISQGETQNSLSKSLASLPKMLPADSMQEKANEALQKLPPEKTDVLGKDFKKHTSGEN